MYSAKGTRSKALRSTANELPSDAIGPSSSNNSEKSWWRAGSDDHRAKTCLRSQRILSAEAVACLLLALLLTTHAWAQQGPSPAPVGSLSSPQDLAKAAHNPFQDFVKIPFQIATGFGIGTHHNVGASLNIEPVIPFSLNAEWDFIARPNWSLTYLPSPHEQFGLQDLQTQFFLTPARNTTWIWGVGPILQFPTASSSGLGAGKWAAGPTAGFVYSQGPWLNGVIAYQLMSYAGNHSRGSINLTDIQPQISYSLESGWYAQCAPEIDFDWTAPSGNAWTVPVGADIGKAFNLGPQAMTLQLGSYDFVKHPSGNPQWMIRINLTLLFPT